MIRKVSLIAFFVIGMAAVAWATHNRAGEISVRQVGDCTNSLTVEATIITYSKASSEPADRDTLTICWGDGSCEIVARQNGPIIPSEGPFPQGERLENDTKKNIYVALHTFPARGTYVISMTDPNRNGGIENVNFPNSEQIKFHIQTTYTFPNPQFQGCNNTPVLLQPPIDIGCVGQPFIHNPNAYDADGDSLSYELIVPFQEVKLEVPNYQFPNAISPSPMNNLSIDPVTGDILWDAPQRKGEYNLAMIIVEWRDGFPLDTIVRDMQILIQECDNLPPEIETPFDEICVIAGEVLEFDVIATAPLEETEQKVRLTALGGPFEVAISPATFLPDSNLFRDDPVVKRFRWATSCEHISDQYYSVVFKAVDNFFSNDTTGLATLKTIRIKVVGPPPQDVRAEPSPNFIEVTWEKPYFCEDAADNYFQGFTVWRRVNSNEFEIDTCTTGLEGRGYQKLTPFSIREEVDGRYYYRDDNIEQGKVYCYRILAEFAKTTPGGRYAYNLVESLPSPEGCIEIKRDIPFMLRADVLSTGTGNGEIELCWSKPIAEELDTTVHKGPYAYEILRAEGINPDPADFAPIGVRFTSNSFAEPIDTCYTDIGLNTLSTAYSYRINFYTGASTTEPFATTDAASSVFLTVAPTNEANRLFWQAQVPWDNYSYTVFKQNAAGTFDSLATVTSPSFIDTGLVNGSNYCYFIRALGSYGVTNLPEPLINNSQIACGSPFDDEPPCPPILMVDDICDDGIDCTDLSQLINTLNWDNPNETCEDTDTRGYRIYYAENENAPLIQIGTIDDERLTTFDHQPATGIAGCYAVSAIDTAGNESEFSPLVCVDNCPTYELPNAFTPNGDGSNDVYRPFPFCFIERIEMNIFNRWGQLVFTTTDPSINWDGTNQNGDPLEEGIYVYTCKVFEQRVTGSVAQEEILRGYIELIRSE